MIVPFDDCVVDVVASNLDKAGIVIIPCDTIYGICGRVSDTARKINDVKGRDESKRYIVLVSNIEQADGFLAHSIDRRLSRCWPAPLTVIATSNDGGTVALRIPANSFLQNLLERVGPIYSTSVNRSSAPHMGKIAEIIEEFEGEVDLIVDAGDLVDGIPSTIVDITSSPYRIVRRGAYHFDESLLSSGLISRE